MPQHDDEQKPRDLRLRFMSDAEIRMVDDYLARIDANRGEMGDFYTDWEKIQEAYAGDQPLKENHPNSRVNIINANIEGQVSSLVEQNLAVVCRPEGPSDKGYADWARIGLDWTLRQNQIKRLIRRHELRREKFGPAFFKIYWDADAVKGFGLAKITCPPLTAVFVDSKINDALNLQDADYIAEVMPKSKTWAKEKYGDRADNIGYGNHDRAPVFTKDTTLDDEDTFWLIQLWTKTKGKLRLIEFSDDGIQLFDSFKTWNGKRFVEKDSPKAFYRYNKLPYFLTNMYEDEGKLLGFGDGKLLRPLQDMINDFYDQIRRTCRPNRVFFDPASEVDLEDIDADDGAVPCNDPNNNIRVVETGRVNPALWQLLTAIHQEVQRTTRFSELMMGQKSMGKTATEAAIQHQQGSSATDHKKLMLQETLTEVCTYALDLMMENYTEGRAFRINEDQEDYDWIDFRQLNHVPVMMPATSAFGDEFRKLNPEQEAPKWMQVTEESGQGMTKSVDLDIEINIGAGLPKNKAFLYQMLEKLAGMIVEGRNVVSWKEIRTFARDFLGLSLEDDASTLQQLQAGQQEQIAMQQALQAPPAAGAGAPMQGADVAGMSPAGRPMLSALPGGGR